ncbi:MAG TPA: CpaF family protein [Stellaceae bacterium]|nr:CpaF family protein [Stellaceae bacterium]
MKRLQDPTAEPDVSEENRRRHRRTRTFANGILATAQGTVRCRVLDVSPEGARIQLDRGEEVAAAAITVREPAALTIKGLGVFPGRVAWRRSTMLGIHITEGHPVQPELMARSAEDLLRINPPQMRSGVDNPATLSDAPPVAAMAAQVRSDAVSVTIGGNKAERERIEAAVSVLHPRIMERIQPEVAVRIPEARLGEEIAALVAEIAQEVKLALSGAEQGRVKRRILDEMVGFGPLEPLLADDSISDILVNGPRQIFVERRGRLELTDITFADDQHVLNVASRIVTKAGRRIDESSPIADARLPDGSRINVIIPPLALRGPMLSIRKFSKTDPSIEALAQSGSLSPAMATLLSIAARCRLNMVISGGTGAGKTTLLNALAQMIDPGERIITIEDAAELQIGLPHVASLETRPPNLEGRNEVGMRDLLRNALRMRPDRIILGEVRGAEAFDMLQAMNTGHDGSLCTIHASGPREAMTRLENMVLMSGYDLPARFVRAQIASAVHIIIQIARLRDGRRRVVSVTEIAGTEADVITSQELFTFRPEGEGPRGEVLGRFMSTGLRPRFLVKAEQYGLGQALQRVFVEAEAEARGAG